MPKSKQSLHQPWQVFTTQGAETDIDSIISYLLAQDESESATRLLAELAETLDSLSTFPLRGHLPPELSEHPDKNIREVHVSAYRVIYRVIAQDVFIIFVADGRRNIQQALLTRALRVTS